MVDLSPSKKPKKSAMLDLDSLIANDDDERDFDDVDEANLRGNWNESDLEMTD